MNRKPHIVIFNPDEMRYDCVGHLGHNPAALTPFLDEFVREEAVSFDRAFCQNPVCVPSRCSFFTGLYPHVRGHRTMTYMLHQEESSLFTELLKEGYYVWMNTRNDLVAAQIPGLLESHAAEIYYSSGDYIPQSSENSNPRGQMGDKNFYSHYVGKLNCDENGISRSDDDCIVDAAIHRIMHPVDDRPMCLFLGLFYPHTPYNVEEPYFSAIDRSKLPPRAARGVGKPLIHQALRDRYGMDSYTEEDWNELRGVYHGMCLKLDGQFCRLVQALKDADIYDDTLIVILSDHGDFAGDYDLPEKAQNSFEDCLTRVPLIIKPPKSEPVDPGVSESLVELVDFYATVMDYVGVEPDHTQFGKSLRAVVADRSKKVRNVVYCEGGRLPGETHCDEYHAACGPTGVLPKIAMYWPRQDAQRDDEAHTKGTMIRGDRWKYIHRTSGAHELYDLEADPREEHNIYGQPGTEAVTAELRMKMLDWFQSTSDIVPKKPDARFPFKMVWQKIGRNFPPEAEPLAREIYSKGAGLAALPALLQQALEKMN